MKNTEDYCIMLPESMIIEAAASCRDDPENGFQKCLEAAEDFRKAGLTPLYILDPYYMDLVVVAKETFRKPLN